MLTILAGEPLASMMIVLRSEFFTRWPTVSVVLSIVKSWQQPGPATASLSRSLYFRQSEKAGKFLSMTTPAHDKDFQAKTFKNFQ